MATHWIVFDENPEKMNLEYFQGIRIFRPRLLSEVEIRQLCEAHLRSEYSVGAFTDSTNVNRLLQRQFDFFQTKLVELIRPIAGRDFMAFLLAQYDFSCQIDSLYKQDALDDREVSRWNELGPRFRRAVKYLAELVVMHHQGAEPNLDNLDALEAVDRAFIFAEQMVDFYILSDQTYSLFPDRTVAEIHPEGQPDYFSLRVTDNPAELWRDRISRDRESRHRFLDVHECLFYNVTDQARILDEAFEAELGMSYNDCLAAIWEVVDKAKPAESGFQIPFCSREQILDALQQASGNARTSIERALSGFSITKTGLQTEQRALFRPKQEYRAYRRAFFEFPWETGLHLTWSKGMAKENYIQLVTGMLFKQCPSEWNTERIRQAIETLSNEAGRWFEAKVEALLERYRIVGRRSFRRGIGMGDDRISIPDGVGEIDYLGVLPAENLLIIAECKLVRGGLEPTYFRDDISDFVSSSDSYVKKFSRKVDWVSDNFPAVVRSLRSEPAFPSDISPKALAPVIITCFPTFASYFIDEYSCVSITELCMELEATSSWPYASRTTS